jgi:hypothetical protein
MFDAPLPDINEIQPTRQGRRPGKRYGSNGTKVAKALLGGVTACALVFVGASALLKPAQTPAGATSSSTTVANSNIGGSPLPSQTPSNSKSSETASVVPNNRPATTTPVAPVTPANTVTYRGDDNTSSTNSGGEREGGSTGGGENGGGEN